MTCLHSTPSLFCRYDVYFSFWDRVDLATVEDIRASMLEQAARRKIGIRNKSNLAWFARTEDAAATCATAHSAGGNGLDVCISQCENRRSWFGRAPYVGACHLLCALAVAPCHK